MKHLKFITRRKNNYSERRQSGDWQIDQCYVCSNADAIWGSHCSERDEYQGKAVEFLADFPTLITPLTRPLTLVKALPGSMDFISSLLYVLWSCTDSKIPSGWLVISGLKATLLLVVKTYSGKMPTVCLLNQELGSGSVWLTFLLLAAFLLII